MCRHPSLIAVRNRRPDAPGVHHGRPELSADVCAHLDDGAAVEESVHQKVVHGDNRFPTKLIKDHLIHLQTILLFKHFDNLILSLM